MADMSQITHHVQHYQAIKPVITGVPMLYTAISSLVSLAAGFGLGWYIKGRGMTGVQIDLNNVKMDVENLKAKLSAPTPAPAA